jgi:hypothetical protein
MDIDLAALPIIAGLLIASAMISVIRARTSRWRARIVVLGSFHAAERSLASPVKSGRASPTSGARIPSSRCRHASTRSSAVSHALSQLRSDQTKPVSSTSIAYTIRASRTTACCSAAVSLLDQEPGDASAYRWLYRSRKLNGTDVGDILGELLPARLSVWRGPAWDFGADQWAGSRNRWSDVEGC